MVDLPEICGKEIAEKRSADNLIKNKKGAARKILCLKSESIGQVLEPIIWLHDGKLELDNRPLCNVKYDFLELDELIDRRGKQFLNTSYLETGRENVKGHLLRNPEAYFIERALKEDGALAGVKKSIPEISDHLLREDLYRTSGTERGNLISCHNLADHEPAWFAYNQGGISLGCNYDELANAILLGCSYAFALQPGQEGIIANKGSEEFVRTVIKKIENIYKQKLKIININ